LGREPEGYGVGDGDAEVFLVVVAAFFVVVVSFFAAVSFLVVAAVELDVEVVVIVSFLFAHEVIKPNTARTATDVIRDCFIGVVNECPECPARKRSASIN
jgi:hypothetical protein